MSGKTYLSPAKFRIFAHRGTTELGAVENTIQAFKDAIATGADYIETDVQATKDGQIVLFHDDSLLRILGVNKTIADISLIELEAIAKNKGLEIPLLSTALFQLPEVRFNIDVKTEKAVLGVIGVIEASRAKDRVLLSSFKASRREPLIMKLPDVATSADSTRVLKLVLGLALGSGKLIEAALKGLDAVQIPLRFLFLRLDSRRLIQECHRHAVEVHYWTVNDAATAKRLKALGADGIVTDRCKLMRLELAE